jgi:F420-dependent oxidoreductase-like protein
MELGLQLSNVALTTPADRIGPAVVDVVTTAERAGFTAITAADHLWQTTWLGGVEQNMLEAYSVLSFVAAHTSRVSLLAAVSGVHYRHPAMLGKLVTTLDVLSGGRAWLGIGSGQSAGDVEGYGLPFPPLRQRYEMLGEAIEICLRMWTGAAGSDEPFTGTHYRVERPLNVPQSITRPHPPILIAGDGEQRTLPLVARYADMCNLRPGPALPHKLDVLRRCCEEIGRDYDSIRKTCMFAFDVGPGGERAGALVDALGGYAELGIDLMIGRVEGVDELEPLRVMGRDVIPMVADL